MITHFVGSPLRKFASFAWPVNVLKRSASFGGVEAGLAAVAVDDLRPDVGRPVVLERPVVLRAALEQVLRPLRRSTDRLWNCRVERPLFMLTSLLRHPVEQALAERRVRRRRARARRTWPRRPRTCRPSGRRRRRAPVMNCSGLPGTVTIACWSGWIASRVVGIAVLRQVAEGRSAVGRQQPRRARSTARAAGRRRTSRRGRRRPGARPACRRRCRTSTARCSSRCSATSSCR